VLGAILLDIGSMPEIQSESILIMFATSFITGYISIDILIGFAERVNFSVFCIILGIAAAISAVPGLM